MALRGFIKFLTICGLVAAGSAALAQTPECNRYRAELAAIDRNGASAQNQRLRSELSRMQDYYRSIGCERRGFLFSSPPPEECPAIAQRIRNLAASLDRADAGGDIALRRQQLVQAINQNCSGGDNRNFFERLFGAPPSQQPVEDPNAPISEEPTTPTLGGSKTVCVRMCDGYDFPLATAGKTTPDEMCQALCPGAETRAFSMPASDDGLLRAVSVSGRTPYSTLAGAFRFQKSIDPSTCYCKTDQQKWSDVLQRAEQLLDRHDTIISPERAAEMSRAPALRTKQAAIAKQLEQADAAETQAAAKEGEAAPTAGRESAGIGPQSIESGRIVTLNEGVKIEGKASDGSKRTIRVITPGMVAPALTDEGESQ